MRKTIHYIDMFAGMGGFREGLTRAGDFVCMGHCEIDKYADRSYRALFDTEGEWFIDDARKADPDTMPDFELLCGGFPCQAFSLAGNRREFGDPRGTLFFELARLAEARKPRYLLFENVPGLLSHNGGRTFATILHTLDRLGYGVEWQVLNSKDFGVPQSRRRVYIVGYLDERCRGKILPFTDTTGNALAQIRRGAQGERVYSPEGVSCTLAAQAGGFGGRTGLYAVGLPIKEVTRKGYKMAYEGDSIDISYYSTNTRRGRVGHKIAHTLTTGATQGALCFIDMNRNPKTTEIARCLTAKQSGGIHHHKREASGVLHNGRIRRLTPRECLRLQGWTDERIDKVLAIQSDNQVYKQAGNGVTVNVVEAIGRRLIEVEIQLLQRIVSEKIRAAEPPIMRKALLQKMQRAFCFPQSGRLDMNRKNWIRLLCTALAVLLFAAGSGVSFAMAEQPKQETTVTEEQTATPETAESARLSLTVLDSDYSGSENGNIDESLFERETDHAEIAAGKLAPLLLQVDGPAHGSSVTVKLDESAQFCDPRGLELSGQEWKRTIQQESRSAWMLYVTSDTDFTVTATYEDQTGAQVTRTANITMKATPTLFRAAQAGVTAQYHITDVSQVGGEWLITFEGENESYCMDEGLNGRPSSSVYWTYYGTTDLLDKAAAAGCTSKLDVQRYVWEHRGEASDSGSAYVYAASEPGWQNVVTRYAPADLPTEPGEPEEYFASWEAPSQSASGSFDLTFTVNADKQQLETGEKVDGAKITVTPSKTSGSIDGGSWQMSPAGAQTITTSGHTNDDNYQNNSGDGTVSWTVHYEVSKTSTTTLSGQEGPFSSQAEANAAAEAAKNAAISQLKNEAQGMVDAAIAAARAELATIRFSYDEVEIPYGFEEFNGSLGSHQTITVPADSSNDYVMKNDEWSLQVNLKKVDSETGEQIAGDALYEVYEWDTVTQQYIPFGGYNQYTVIRNEDGTYSVANGTDYGTEYDTSRKMYYTQRNEGKFIIVETRAPSGYYGDWTDVEHPGTAGTPLGKRGYYIEITKANDDSVVTLDNTHHSADIATSYTGGTKLLTSGGVETTVTIYKASDEPAAEIQYQEAGRVYNTDNSGTAAKEDSYIMTPKEGVMQNDRSLGEISISKVDLDAVRYVGGRDTDGDAMASGQAHADARLDGAVYDLYAAEDIQHPDGVTGTVDYSKITYADGTPIWHTTIRDNSGQWVDDYLPVLAKDHLVASAVIENGCLTFSNLYLGKYYIVERGTGVVIPVEDGAYKLSGTYPDVDGKTKEPTGTTSQLATNNAGQYTDYVYKHQWSYIGQSKALDGTKTYDGYYESYATGYLCDEHNYYITPAYADEGWYIEKTAFEDNRRAEGEQLDTTTYSANYHLHRDNVLAESQDQVMKGNVELSKHVSSTGSSDGIDLEGAGFTFYLISDLSKEDQFAQTRSGKYLIKSILDVYINPEYDESHPKYDFSGEAQAIAKTYEINAGEIAAYNETLTVDGDFKNGKGDGWVATGRPKEYQLAEIFSNDTGTIRVQGLPYGQYLVVETTTPKDVFQAQPFIVDIDPTDPTNPQSAMANPKDAVQTPSDSYQKYTVLDEEIEVYLRVTKIDEETGKAVLLKGTAFQIYWMDEQGNHIYDENGNAKLVIMTDTTNPLLPKDVDTFYTDDTGMLVLPEKLPLGHYRLVEVNAPNGFYNEWVASAVYEDGHLQIDDTGNFADGSFYVDFSVTTDRAYKANGDDNENSQDILVIDEDYQNNETLGVLKIRKTGEVLTGWQEDEGDTFDPEFSGEARPGYFVYEERPIPYAEYTITANEDIYTQDCQTDANGNRTLWYAKGDVVAVVRTGDGTSDIAAFAPGRTNSTYDFLSVIHDGTVGEVIVTLPLGSYHVEETTAPYGFVGTKQSYDVTFVWDKQTNDVVLAKTITSNPGNGSASETKNYEIVNVKDASAAQIDAQVLKFHNERVKPQLDIYKQDIKTGALVAGAVYNLITVDDIYSATGDLLFRAGDLIATSAPTDENGHTTFTCDFPMRGEFYGMGGVRIPENTTANSGKYRIVELRPPQGYYLDAPDQVFEFVYQGAATPVIEMENTFENDATSFFVSKRKLTGDEELPGATLTIQDKDGNVVRQWVSGDTPTEIRGLKFDTVYTLVETAAPNGYELAESMRFKLIQRKDENGDLLNEADVYVCTGKDWLIFDHWTLLEDGMVVMRDAPSPDTPENPSSTPTPTPEQPASTPTPTPTPVTNLPQTGDIPWLPAVLLGTAVVAAMGLMLIRKWKHAGGQNSQSKEK